MVQRDQVGDLRAKSRKTGFSVTGRDATLWPSLQRMEYGPRVRRAEKRLASKSEFCQAAARAKISRATKKRWAEFRVRAKKAAG